MKRGVLFSFLLLMVVLTRTFLRSPYGALQYGARSLADRVVQNSLAGVHDISALILQTNACFTRSEMLELANRRLEKQLSEKELASSGFLATASAYLSTHDGKWIVLSAPGKNMEHGDIVLSDGLFLGTLDRVTFTYATIMTPQTSDAPIPVIHAKTRVMGLMRMESGALTVLFTQRIQGVVTGDTLQSVPDGLRTKDSYPIAAITSDQTTQESSVTIVRVRPLVTPRVLDAVSILGRRQ